MKKYSLGKTGITVTELCFGALPLGPLQANISVEKGAKLIRAALEKGINFIDTAPAYGSSEKRLGRLLPGRHDWVIMTKVGEIFERGESRFDFSYDYTRQSVEQSLRTLRRDMIDIVLVHSDGNDMDIIKNEGAFEALEKLRQQGLIRAFGMSSKTVEGGIWVVEHCDVVMATFNLETDEELPVIQRAHELNKGVVIKKGLQSGHASNVEHAFEHVLCQPGVSSMIVGTINPKHLRENSDIASHCCAASK